VTHLVENGHERIAYISRPAAIRQVADRLEGALRALGRYGRPRDSLLVIEASALNVASGKWAGAKIIEMPEETRPTAVFCANDLIALGVLQEMTHNGVRVPEDISIVGYDDIEFAAAAAVPLTSVRQPRLELGRTAARLLLEESDGTQGHQHRQVIFEPELVSRRSTQASGTQHQLVRPALFGGHTCASSHDESDRIEVMTQLLARVRPRPWLGRQPAGQPHSRSGQPRSQRDEESRPGSGSAGWRAR